MESAGQPDDSPLTIFCLDYLTAAEVAPFIDGIGGRWDPDSLLSRTDLWELKIIRRPAPPAASGPFIDPPVIALIFAAAAVATGFLEEIGKDIYRSVRAHLHRLYLQGAERGQSRGSDAFIIKTEVNGRPAYLRFRNGSVTRPLGEEEFARALAAAKTLLEADLFGHEPQTNYARQQVYVIEWNPDDNTWQASRVIGPYPE
jgi:hypothetical protein